MTEVTETTTSNEVAETLATVVAKAALDLKAQKIVGLNTQAVSSFSNEFIIATGTSNRHVRAVSDAILEAAKGFGRMPDGKEGYPEGRWILLDFGDVVVHVFQEEVREYYDLERLWSEATVIDFTSLGIALPGSDEDEAEGSSLEAEGSVSDPPSGELTETTRLN
jgi:ribosome-associated protein